jgi:hypothetical protein
MTKIGRVPHIPAWNHVYRCRNSSRRLEHQEAMQLWRGDQESKSAHDKNCRRFRDIEVEAIQNLALAQSTAGHSPTPKPHSRREEAVRVGSGPPLQRERAVRWRCLQECDGGCQKAKGDGFDMVRREIFECSKLWWADETHQAMRSRNQATYRSWISGSTRVSRAPLRLIHRI